MKKSFICVLLLLVNFSYSAWGDVSDRMKARLSDVVAAKDAGTVGEGVDGYLHLRSSTNSSAQKLVEAENADRKELFQKLSAKTGGDVSAVARQFSQSIASKAKSGHWFKKSSGTWVQK